MGQTIAEKILSNHNLAEEAVYVGDSVDARIDGVVVAIYAGIEALFRRMGFSEGPPIVFDPDKVFVMNDHYQPPLDVASARRNRASRIVVERLGITHFHESEMGICHQIMFDNHYLKPGQIVIGQDSHTVAHGAVNVAATGFGWEEIAYAWVFGELFFTVPESIKVVLEGSPRPYPIGKDIMLYLAGRYGDDFARDCSIEYTGSLAESMTLANRVTLADHAVEVGAKFGLFAADDKTYEYIDGVPGVDFSPVVADGDAEYAREITVDFDEIGFQVAKPYTFDNVVPVGEVSGVRIDQARLGSCANGRFEDIEIAARILAGRKVAKHVKFYVSPASVSVYKQCVDAGIVSTLLEAGVQFDTPGCSICQSPGVVLNEEVCISSTTRNYRGRFGGSTCAEAELYLASPATVVASVLVGEITDPTEFLR